MRRLKELYPSKKILACAPSDPAADILASRLSEYFHPSQLFRLNWWQRVPSSLNSKLIPYSHVVTSDDTQMFELYDASVLNNFEIIVTTAGTAGALAKCYSSTGYNTLGANTSGMPCIFPMLFDVVVMDEASQATEAEVSRILA